MDDEIQDLLSDDEKFSPSNVPEIDLLFSPQSMDSQCLHLVGRKSYLSANVKEMLGSQDLMVNTVVLGIVMQASLFTFLFLEFYMKLTDQVVLLGADLVACFIFIALSALLSSR